MWQLSRVLSEAAGVPVEIRWSGSGWRLEWADGPTATTMRIRAAELAERVGADVEALRYYRAATNAAEVAALLAWLEQHPEKAAAVTYSDARHAHNDTDHPDRLGAATLRRARALCDLHPAGMITPKALGQLRTYAGLGGWPAVLAWLDGLAAAQNDPDVVSLAQFRDRREG